MKQKHKAYPIAISIFCAGILVVAGASILYPRIGVTFTDTPETPPDGNVEAPINIGPDDQWKEGNLGIGTTSQPTSKLEVNGVTNLRGDVFVESGNAIYADDMWVGEKGDWLTNLLDNNAGGGGDSMELIDRLGQGQDQTNIETLTRKGDYLYLYTSSAGRDEDVTLDSFDISDPRSLERVGSLSLDSAQGAGDYPEKRFDFVNVVNGYAYLLHTEDEYSNNIDELWAVDVSDPSNMQIAYKVGGNQVAQFNDGQGPDWVDPISLAVEKRGGNTYLYIYGRDNQEGRLLVKTIDNQGNLSEVSNIQTASQSEDLIGANIGNVTIHDEKVFLTSRGNSKARIVDVADLNNPSVSTLNFPKKIGKKVIIQNNHLITHHIPAGGVPGEPGFRIFDWSTENMKSIVSQDGEISAFDVVNDTAYLVKGKTRQVLRVDISDVTSPKVVDRIRSSNYGDYLRRSLIAATNTHVFPILALSNDLSIDDGSNVYSIESN